MYSVEEDAVVEACEPCFLRAGGAGGAGAAINVPLPFCGETGIGGAAIRRGDIGAALMKDFSDREDGTARIRGGGGGGDVGPWSAG